MSNLKFRIVPRISRMGSTVRVLICQLLLISLIGYIIWPVFGSAREKTFIRETSTLGSISTLETEPLSSILSEEDSNSDNSSASSSSDPPARNVVKPTTSNLALFAVNPGYPINGVDDTGEFIELVNLSEDIIDLSGVKIIYTNSNNNPSDLYVFDDGAQFIGEKLLLRFENSPEVTADPSVKTADDTYSSSLAYKAGLLLNFGDKTLSSVCWRGGTDCLPAFSTSVKSRLQTTIWRLENGEYQHTNDYLPIYSIDSPGLFLPETEEPDDPDDSSSTGPSTDTQGSSSTNETTASPQCAGLQFTEILSYYTDSPDEQFLEVHNPTDHSIELFGCKILNKNKKYDIVVNFTTINSGDYFAYRPDGYTFTKNPTKENTIELIDVTGDSVAKITYPHGQKKSTSYALFDYNSGGEENWKITYNPTPGAENIFQEFRSCPAGKTINVATGNCVNITSISSTLQPCPAGKYRNPETGRCKSISSSDSEQTPCKTGYERNPETNRCRKIKENNGADYSLVPLTGVTEKSTFIAIWAIIGVATLGAGYVIFQFRKEILHFIRKLLAKFRHG